MKKQRIQVTAPGEAPVIYAKGQEPQNKTRLREAERRLKRRQFDGCIDTKDCTNHPLVRRRGDNVFEIGETGCLFVPGALSVEEQMQVIVEAYKCPGSSNLDAHYELVGGARELFCSPKDRLMLRRKACEGDSEAVRALPLEQEYNMLQQHELLRRLRWISIGRQYDWTLKEYSEATEEIPGFVKLLCDKLSKMAGLGAFKAEAGIANFYQPGDSLTSHVDRSEKNMSVPLVSVSAGASCAFVLGGESRDEEPVGLILHSGDALFLSGRSRRCFHGVPVILDPSPLLIPRSQEEMTAFAILGKGRINLNVRQVE